MWYRKYVVIRRPYLLIYDSDKDPVSLVFYIQYHSFSYVVVFIFQVERGVVNLASAKVQYSKDKQNAAVRVQ